MAKEITDSDIKDWIKSYENGQSLAAIARGCNFGRTAITRHLKAHIAIKNKRFSNTHEGYLSRIKVASNTGCWEWQGQKNSRGYGQILVNGQRLLTHRYSYQYYKGAINDLFVLHKCDNRKCSNPDHLFLGNHADNMKDMYDKGRQWRKKMDKSKALEILNQKKSKNFTNAELSKMYNVSEWTVKDVVNNKYNYY